MSAKNDSRAASAKEDKSSREQSAKKVEPLRIRSKPRRDSSLSKAPPRHNKSYHTPPTPPPEELLIKEKSFTLDCIAANTISKDYGKINPKLGPVIPPYNSQRDRHVKNYFRYQGVNSTLRKTDQSNGGTSIDGPVLDRFNDAGAGHTYLYLRNQYGAGHSREQVDGHSQFMSGIKPVTGWHGPFGYRRTTPFLRQVPSQFGVATRSSLH